MACREKHYLSRFAWRDPFFSNMAAIKATGAVLEPVDAASCQTRETSSSLQWETGDREEGTMLGRFQSPLPPTRKRKKTQNPFHLNCLRPEGSDPEVVAKKFCFES